MGRDDTVIWIQSFDFKSVPPWEETAPANEGYNPSSAASDIDWQWDSDPQSNLTYVPFLGSNILIS